MGGCVQEKLRKGEAQCRGQRSEFLFSEGQGVEHMLTFSAPQFSNVRLRDWVEMMERLSWDLRDSDS